MIKHLPNDSKFESPPVVELSLEQGDSMLMEEAEMPYPRGSRSLGKREEQPKRSEKQKKLDAPEKLDAQKTPTPQESLSSLIDRLHQEWIQLQILGRSLTPAEQQRSQFLEQVLAQLRSALILLAESSPPAPSSRDAALLDGRYAGENGELRVELRVDEKVSGIISADFFRLDVNGETWVASIRTNPGSRISLRNRFWSIVGEDQAQSLATGRLTLAVEQSEPLTLSGTLRLDRPLAGIRGREDITFTVVWQSEALRTLGLELEREANISELPTFPFNGQEITVSSALAKAGLEIVTAGQPSMIPTPPTGWGTAQLHALMQEYAQASLLEAKWELHLLLLGKPSRLGLLGVMFDTTANLPRQGSAVFAEEIRRLAPDNYKRKLIQTTIHELGHALNLAHRFEREVGRADSTSFMNYDWRYRGGGQTQEFWRKFDFTFDPDELAFLRHAPLSAVIPGGHAFHSVSYWAEGNGGYSPYFPEVRISDLELKLTGPIGGVVFDFLQPVFLQVELINRTRQSLELPNWLLDPKAGALDVIVRRVTDSGSTDRAVLWAPVMQRCYELVPQAVDTVAAGGSICRNLNLTFGAGGFTFAEPGEYEVQTVVSLPNQSQQREYIIPSNRLRIRIGYPQTREEEKDAMVLLRRDVGLYFALGGSHVLEAARDDLEAICARRQGQLRKIKDPLVTNIVRCAGIDAGRTYVRRRDGRFIIEEGQRERAADLLEKLDDQDLQAFDFDTATNTKKLAQKHRQAVL